MKKLFNGKEILMFDVASGAVIFLFVGIPIAIIVAVIVVIVITVKLIKRAKANNEAVIAGNNTEDNNKPQQ